MNIENMKKLIDLMKSLPDERFDMMVYAKSGKTGCELSSTSGVIDALENECGSVGCIAGWACTLASDLDSDHAMNTAAAWLGLDAKEADALFHGHWSRKSWMDITRADAVARLETMLASAAGNHG